MNLFHFKMLFNIFFFPISEFFFFGFKKKKMFGKKNAPKEDPDLLISKLRKKNRCSVCRRVLTNEKYLRCTVCPYYCICIECFSDGLITEKHQGSHEMIVIDPEPLMGFTEDWNSNEELLLLSGVQKFGIGNWNTIAEYIGTKNALQIQSHYSGIYIENETAPLPNLTIQQPIPAPLPPPYQTKQKLKSYPSDRSNKNRIKQNEYSNPAEFCGWMPYRHEFETQLNQNAEELISSIEFEQEKETLESFQDKIHLLTVYNEQVDERIRRTEQIENWDLQHLEKSKDDTIGIDSRFLGGESMSEKEIDSLLLPFSQYFSKEKLQAVARALHNLDSIKNSFEKRIEWIQKGVKTPEEGDLYDQLSHLIVNDTIPVENMLRWNQLIMDYKAQHFSGEDQDINFLSNEEIQLCKTHNIETSLYVSLKDLFIREITANGPLSFEDALQLSGMPENIIRPIYNALNEFGWNKPI